MAENSAPFIKICCMTREEDAVLAINLGANAIGLLFYDKSSRHVSTEKAKVIANAVPDQGIKVGLFVDAGDKFVRDVLDQVPLDILQFHGSESRDYCNSFDLPYWKTLRAKSISDLQEEITHYPEAMGILLDTWHPTKAGGTGEVFDWTMLDELVMEQDMVLAGGLNPGNIEEAMTKVKPWAVDVCSGVEESPGIKSRALMKQFIDGARSV
jgi:phosphoribosylanthranilate isomerase